MQRVLYTRIILFLFSLTACPTIALASPIEKEDAIIFIDRTTTIGKDSTDNLIANINAIVKSGRIHGRINIYEIRDKTFSTSLITTFSVPQRCDTEKLKHKLSNKDKPHSFQDYIFSPPNNDRALLVQECKNTNNHARILQQEICENIRNRIDKSVAPTKTTSLIEEIPRIISEENEKDKHTTVFIYSDMEDTLLRNKQRDVKYAWEESGRKKAQELSTIFPIMNDKKSYDIIIWGVGRDEADTGNTKTPSKYHNYLVFWNTFIREYFGSALNKLIIRHDFPLELFSN